MISSERTQNIIIVVTILLGVISAVSLAGNALHYSGSYALVAYLDVDLEEVQVRNLDPSNDSSIPRLSFIFNAQTIAETEGEAYLRFLGLAVMLNGHTMTSVLFRYLLPADERALYPGFNNNYTLSQAVEGSDDKQAIFDAATSGVWQFNLTLRYTYTVLQSDTVSARYIFIYHEGVQEI